MNLLPPPRNATISQLEKWCRDLFLFLQLPTFEIIKFTARSSAPNSETGITYFDSNDNIAKMYDGGHFQNLYSDGISIPHRKMIEIGDWNMDATSAVAVSHSLTASKIIGIRVYIRKDSDGDRYPLDTTLDGSGSGVSGYFSADTLHINLFRVTGGFFDQVDFDATSYNRGWIIIDYLD
jgi:hypothetical protein